MVGLERETRAKNRHKAKVVGMYVAHERTGRGIGELDEGIDRRCQGLAAWNCWC